MKITVFFEHFQKAFEKKLLYNEPMKFTDHVKKPSLFLKAIFAIFTRKRFSAVIRSKN